MIASIPGHPIWDVAIQIVKERQGGCRGGIWVWSGRVGAGDGCRFGAAGWVQGNDLCFASPGATLLSLLFCVSAGQAGSAALRSTLSPQHHQPASGPGAAGWKGGAGALHTTGPKIVRDAYLSLFNTTLGESDALYI